MIDLYNTVKKAVSDVATTSDKTETLKKDVMGRFSSIESAIDNAYRE